MAEKANSEKGRSQDGSVSPEQLENTRRDVLDVDPTNQKHLNAVFENPLANVPKEQLMKDVEAFCQRHELTDHLDVFKKGALVSQRPWAVQGMEELTADDKLVLEREHTHKWDQPWRLYWLVSMASLAAAVQGMDETVNNGAQSFYLAELGITPSDRFSKTTQNNLTGLIVGAPYLACAILGCWLTEPLNRIFARRGTIFISCAIAAIASIWEGVANSWVNLFIARFVLGLGIGAKSTTVPVYTAECSPAPIRGALVMQWQVWTAFGIMLGNIMGVAFGSLAPNLAWRLILGSTVVLPILVCAQVYFCPGESSSPVQPKVKLTPAESPRWLIQHGKVKKAYLAFRILRNTDLQAARDLYYTFIGVELEAKINRGKNLFTMFWELFSIPRNRRAALATWIVMFGQQFCGVNGQSWK